MNFNIYVGGHCGPFHSCNSENSLQGNKEEIVSLNLFSAQGEVKMYRIYRQT